MLRGAPASDAPPIANIDSVAAVEDLDGDGVESVTLTQTSTDDLGIVEYTWSINGGVVVGTAASLTYDFPVGETTVDLLVRDAADQTSTDSVLVQVEEVEDSMIIIDVGEIYSDDTIYQPTEELYLVVDSSTYTYPDAQPGDIINFTNFVDQDTIAAMSQTGNARSVVWIQQGTQWYRAKKKHAKQRL